MDVNGRFMGLFGFFLALSQGSPSDVCTKGNLLQKSKGCWPRKSLSQPCVNRVTIRLAESHAAIAVPSSAESCDWGFQKSQTKRKRNRQVDDLHHLSAPCLALPTLSWVSWTMYEPQMATGPHLDSLRLASLAPLYRLAMSLSLSSYNNSKPRKDMLTYAEFILSNSDCAMLWCGYGSKWLAPTIGCWLLQMFKHLRRAQTLSSSLAARCQP